LSGNNTEEGADEIGHVSSSLATDQAELATQSISTRMPKSSAPLQNRLSAPCSGIQEEGCLDIPTRRCGSFTLGVSAGSVAGSGPESFRSAQADNTSQVLSASRTPGPVNRSANVAHAQGQHHMGSHNMTQPQSPCPVRRALTSSPYSPAPPKRSAHAATYKVPYTTRCPVSPLAPVRQQLLQSPCLKGREPRASR
jgi:hypothetical protein